MKIMMLLATLVGTMFVCCTKGRSLYRSALIERLKRADQHFSEIQAEITIDKMRAEALGHGLVNLPAAGKRKRSDTGYLESVLSGYEETPSLYAELEKEWRQNKDEYIL